MSQGKKLAQDQLGFLASAQGTLIELRSMLPVGSASVEVQPMADIADTARQLALRADEVGFDHISAAADAVEFTADLAQARKPKDRSGFALKIKDQLKALEEQIQEELLETEPRSA